MSEFIFIIVAPIFIIVFCMVISLLILMFAELVEIAWGNVVEVMRDIFYPIGEWISETIGSAIKRIIE